MSRQNVLQMIGRLERLADTMPSGKGRETQALAGQAVGTVLAIKAEFETHGISISSQALYNDIDSFDQSRVDGKDMAWILHQIAGYLRGVVLRIPE